MLKLMVFARAPVAGRCKTRLAACYGARGAARLHRQLVRATLSTACASGLDVELWCAPGSAHGFFHACRRDYGVRLRTQVLGDLGRRMALALARAGGGLLIGTDCAVLKVSDLQAAAAALRAGSDCVLQASIDGGYVLIGTRTAAPSALRGIDWSSGRELAQTRTRLRRLGLRVAELPVLWDIDRPADVRRARGLGLLRA